MRRRREPLPPRAPLTRHLSRRGVGMAKAALVVFAGSEVREVMGRVANALVTAKEFKETGDEVTIVFDGAGTTWIGTLADPSHRYHDAFEEVRDHVAGACSYCAGRYGVTEQIEEAGISLLDEYEQHPSIRRLLAHGYPGVTF